MPITFLPATTTFNGHGLCDRKTARIRGWIFDEPQAVDRVIDLPPEHHRPEVRLPPGISVGTRVTATGI